MKSVAPIRDSRRAILPAAQPVAARDILSQRRERAVGLDPVRLPQTSDHYSPATVDGDDSRYLRQGHGPDPIKGPQRGKWPIGPHLDSHGTTQERARKSVAPSRQPVLATTQKT